MPRSEKTKAAQAIVSQASASIALDLGEKLAQPLATYMVADHTADSPVVESSCPSPALLEVDGREVPDCILVALKRAAEAGRPIGLA